MSFVPIVPFGGIAGWAFLKRTMSEQKAMFASGAEVRRDTDHARKAMSTATNMNRLLDDRQLLKVALGAFGLGDDINNRHFIGKVLSDGTLDATDLANRLSDKRYLSLSREFGFGDYAVPRTQLSDFGDRMADRYVDGMFEAAIGEVNGDLRLALNTVRELPDIASRDMSDTGKWLTVLGSQPLRTVFQTAFGLPASFAQLDLDQQLTALRDKAEQYLGQSEIGQFSDPKQGEALIRNFLLRSQGSSVAMNSPYSTALAILKGVA